MKAYEKKVCYFFGSRRSLSIVSRGLLSFIPFSSFWMRASDSSIFNLGGVYEKPSLSSMAGTVETPGENVKLQCFSKIKFEAFLLTKEDGDHITQNQSSTPQDK
eukprot:bmy_16803T0